MKAFKGFNKDLTCRGFQYKVGETYEEEKAELCHTGFHACEYPLDCFAYYNVTSSVFHEVELEEVSIERSSRDSKTVAKKITIGKHLNMHNIAEKAVEYILAKVNKEYAATNTGDYSAATNTGYYSAATNTGYRSAATNTGYRSAATNTGYKSAATNTGYKSAATNTGDYSAATNTGDYSAAEVSGKDSVAIVTGANGKARGAIGCWLVLTERDSEYNIIEVRSVKVDGKDIKADTWYKMENGKLVEADE